MNTKKLYTFIGVYFSIVLSCMGQNLVFSYGVSYPSANEASVQVYVQNITGGNENLAAYDIVFYYDQTETSVSGFDTSPTTALGWTVFTNTANHIPAPMPNPPGNPAVMITHTGYAQIEVIDDPINGTGLGSDFGPTPVLLMTISFTHTNGVPNTGGDGWLASSANGHPALSYAGNDEMTHPVVIFGPQAQPLDNGALPVSLTSFSAEPYIHDALLTWQTASELNASHYEIERSVDGRTWSKVGQVRAFSETNQARHYSFVDKDAFKPYEPTRRFYYRLRMVDLDATYEYSDVDDVLFKFSADQGIDLELYPNPAHSFININFLFETLKSEMVNLQLISKEGKLLLEREIDASSGQYVLDLPAALPSAVYTIQLKTNDHTISKRFIVHQNE